MKKFVLQNAKDVFGVQTYEELAGKEFFLTGEDLNELGIFTEESPRVVVASTRFQMQGTIGEGMKVEVNTLRDLVEMIEGIAIRFIAELYREKKTGIFIEE